MYLKKQLALPVLYFDLAKYPRLANAKMLL